MTKNMFRTKKRRKPDKVPELRLTEEEIESGLTLKQTLDARRKRGLRVPKVFRLVGLPSNFCRVKDGEATIQTTEGK